MHDYMTLHAHSNARPSHSCPCDATKRSWDCSRLFPEDKKCCLPWCTPLFSVRKVIGKFPKMLKPWGGPEK